MDKMPQESHGDAENPAKCQRDGAIMPSARKRTPLLAAIAATVVAGVVMLLMWPSRTTVSHEALLRQTTKVVLVSYNPEHREVTLIEDEKAIREFTGKMRLVEKVLCACAFTEHLEFHTPRETVERLRDP